ncbi:MAG: glycosyl hydrolase family 1 [Bacteroidota bacterium]|nr:glycosyl hydrolase family 1 [Bacteroidota bacterium]
MKRILKIFIALVLIYAVLIAYLNIANPKFSWDWSKKNVEDINFPKGFQWGTATAAHQVEGGHTNNNWYWWESQKDENGKPRIANNEKSGLAVDHWNRYPEDIHLMNDLGVNSYRFSLSWSKIMPGPNKFDTAAIQHYSDVIDSLKSNNIRPMITLHHFEEPLWFMQKGGFEQEENIRYYLAFVQKVFEAFGDRVEYWCTFNEINVYTSGAYMSGDFPPGKKDSRLAGTVLMNILKSHVKAYRLIKELPHGNQAKVGIVKNIFFFDPKNRLNALDWLGAYFANDNFNNSSLDFFETGEYRFVVPFEANVSYLDTNAPKTLDFIGLNFYSHYSTTLNLVNHDKMFSPVEGEEMSDMEDYTLYPEGIYRAIKRMSKLKVPIIITENGIADAKDDRRGKFIQRSLFAVSEAIKDGYDVRGYYYWSLMDNFEWNLGYSKKFGLYDVDLKTQKRTLREGSKKYEEIVKKFAN